MASLLVIDDESGILVAFRHAFASAGLEVLTAETAAAGLAVAAEHRPDVVVLDVQLPDREGLEVFAELRRRDARTPVIFITGKAGTDTAIEAMKRGAFDYLFKPLELAALRQIVERALRVSRLAHVPAVLAEAGPVDDRADAIVGRCPAMLEVYKAIGRVASQDVTVLITGESGTGKELVARAIYQHSRRATGPFLAINCAAIPEQLLESELFGHEKGAFTGADRRRIGKFEQCSGGTILLDEVGDMSLLTQSKMLRLLQDQQFERLGGNVTLQADVRVLAATNQNLETLVAQGRVRQDLYYRLSGFTIGLPPLRARGDDLALLLHHYLRRLNRELGTSIEGATPEVMKQLRAYPWPGNVRELQSVLRQAILQASGTALLPEFLAASLGAGKAGDLLGGAPDHRGPSLRDFIDRELSSGTHELYAQTIKWVERILLPRVLQATEGNQKAAAQVLGITRGYLRNKLRELGISVTRAVVEDDQLTDGPSLNG
jgi:two-component system nitrogen regulation response regulator GlnG